MKKTAKIFGVVVLFSLIVAIATPLLFKGKFAEIVKEQINKNINATVDFSEIDISLISSFPKAGLTIENLSIINLAPFKGDTLFYAKEVSLKMPLSGLTKTANEAITIDAFTVENALVNIISNNDGVTNYDIAIKEEQNPQTTTTETENGFQFSVQEYEIANTQIKYTDEASQMHINLSEFNHSGSGDLSAVLSKLSTTTSSKISVYTDGTSYLNNNTIALDADIEIDQAQNKYSFLENVFTINQLQLIFDGYVKQLNNATEIDLKFNTPTSDFKNFLALMPQAYSKSIKDVKTNGSFSINGYAKGMATETTIPKFNINAVSENASFKYPDLPKGVKNINLNATLANNTGKSTDTYLDINKLALKIDEDEFNANGKISSITENRFVNMNLKGTLNLGNITQAYPITLDKELKGILKANLNTAFSQNAIDTNNYQQIKNTGNFSISNFEFASKDIVNPIYISEAMVSLAPQKVHLKKLNAKSGSSDINGTGTINNLMGFLFSDKKLKGNFNITSNHFNVSDFMVDNTTEEENTNKESEKGDALKIPAFLDTQIAANAKTVIYDNLTLSNVTGNVSIKEETVTLSNVTSELFEGVMGLSGNMSTKNETPSFNMNLDMSQFDIAKSFKGMDLLTSLAPIAKIFEGKLNTNINLKGNLNNSFTLDLNSLTGNALAEIFTTKITPESAPLINKLDNELSFINLNKLNLDDIKTALSFENGKVAIKPFSLQYDDIAIQIAGAHGFNNDLAYTATFNVPAKYFGSEVGGLLSKLSDDDVKGISVPVVAAIGGSVSNPQIKTDMKQSVSNLTQQLVALQKKKLLNQGTDAIEDAIGGNTGGVVGDVLDGVLGNNNTPKDSTKTTPNNPVNSGVKDVLGGLFGKKKKDSTN